MSFTSKILSGLALGILTGIFLGEMVDVASPRPFLRGEREDLDAVVYSAEGGSAWTLVYPNYSIVVPENTHMQVPMAYPLPRGD